MTFRRPATELRVIVRVCAAGGTKRDSSAIGFRGRQPLRQQAECDHGHPESVRGGRDRNIGRSRRMRLAAGVRVDIPGRCATTSAGCAMIQRRVATTFGLFEPTLRRLSSMAHLMLPVARTTDACRAVAVRSLLTFITSVGCPATPAKTQQRET